MNVDDLTRQFERFIKARNWEKFHTPKNVAMSIAIEAGELLEVFQWCDNLDATAFQDDRKVITRVQEELADVLLYCLDMARLFDFSVEEIVKRKLKANEERFDAEKSEVIQERLNKQRREDP